MQKLSRQTHSFGEFTLDLTRGCLLRGQEEIKLRPKSFEVLKYLVENYGRLISKDELINAVWADTAVTEDSLVQCLKDIRRALGDSEQRIIKTVPRRGYIFDEVVRESSAAQATAFKLEAAGVQIAAEEEGTNGRGVIETTLGQRPRSVGSLPAQRARVTTAIKHHSRSAVLGALTVALATAAIIYFTRPVEAIDSVAVLPFVNVSNDADAEYLSDGISDTIIDSLSQLTNLKKVISLSSVLRYKGQQVDPQVVGRDLNVRAVLMGKLTQRGDDLLISAELVDLKDNTRLWGKQYSRKLADVVRLQGEIAQDISQGLRVKLTSDEKQRLTKRDTADPEAYRLYLLGRFHRRNRLDIPKARDYLEQAIQKDPNFALAYAQLAYVYNNLAFHPSETQARQKAEWAARRALELDDSIGDAHTVLGLLNRDTGELERALELDPNSPDAQQYYAKILWGRRLDEAILHMRRAQELDPVSPVMYVDLGKMLNSARQFDDAMQQYRKALELNSNFRAARRNLAICYAAQGMYEEAIAELERNSSPEARLQDVEYRGYIYGRWGKRAEALKMLDLLNELSKRGDVAPQEFAVVYAGLGDKDKAFEFLQRKHPAPIVPPLSVDPLWDNLRSDPRFEELLRQRQSRER